MAKARRRSAGARREATRLVPERFLGSLVVEDGQAPIRGATWYVARSVGDGLAYRFPAGALFGAKYLTTDMLLDGRFMGVFELSLQEGEEGRRFSLVFALLNQCSARVRFPLDAVDQHRWLYEREGAWLKPLCWGDPVDLNKVDRMMFTVHRKSEEPLRWCMTEILATKKKPPLLRRLVLPKGKLLDELGQSTLHDWPGKSRSPEEVTERLHGQLAKAGSQKWPEGWSRWGGWLAKRFEPSGFFRVEKDSARWWLVDPDGYAFWSAGIDCVHPNIDTACAGLEGALSWMPARRGPYAAIYAGRRGKTINYLAANFIRAFGADDWYKRWAEIALAELRRCGFNTVANWSDWKVASAARFPYVRPLEPRFEGVPMVFRDFPDVFAREFESAAARYALQLSETRDDPAFVGYFLMNEPTWGFAKQPLAAGMLLNTPRCIARKKLAEFLRDRYGGDEAFRRAWCTEAGLANVAEGSWRWEFSKEAEQDLTEFSALMVERFFRILSEACRRADPNHLNLGARYYTVPPEWALAGMRHFDVFSMNCYAESVPRERVSEIEQKLGRPVLVGEWHFGALDVGLPASGIGRVKNQVDRGKAFRFYVEDAASQPACIGVHYFTLYDQSALGRFDGENYNIGFLDVCNRPYEELAAAARITHERLYRIASGEEPPTRERPEYLPRLFV